MGAIQNSVNQLIQTGTAVATAGKQLADQRETKEFAVQQQATQLKLKRAELNQEAQSIAGDIMQASTEYGKNNELVTSAEKGEISITNNELDAARKARQTAFNKQQAALEIRSAFQQRVALLNGEIDYYNNKYKSDIAPVEYSNVRRQVDPRINMSLDGKIVREAMNPESKNTNDIKEAMELIGSHLTDRDIVATREAEAESFKEKVLEGV